MKRILIVGSAGAGKSTLSRKIGEKLDIPVVHLDRYYWKPGWVASEKQEWDRFIGEQIEKEQWILDGNYNRTLEMRLEKADTVIFLDMPRMLCLYRVLKRRIQYHGMTRPDMNEECPESLDFAFLVWVWNYRKRSRNRVVKALEEAKEGKTVIILDSRKKVLSFLEQLPAEI